MKLIPEITNYREFKREGALQGHFTLTINPWGLRVFNCVHFKNSTNEWFSFPSFEVEDKEEEGKTRFIPHLTFVDKEELAAFKAYVVELLQLDNAPVQAELPF